MSSTPRVAQRPAGRDNTPPLRECDIAFLQARTIDPAVADERRDRTASSMIAELEHLTTTVTNLDDQTLDRMARLPRSGPVALLTPAQLLFVGLCRAEQDRRMMGGAA